MTRSILQRFLGQAGVVKTSWDQAFLKGIDLGIDDSVEMEPYKKAEMVYICISTTARAISQVPLEVYQPARGATRAGWLRGKAMSVNWTERNNPGMSKKKGTGSSFMDLVKAGEWEPVPEDHPWQMILDRPTDLMDGYQFTQALVSLMMLDGNVWVIPYPPGIRTPAALYVVPQASMAPRRGDGTGQLEGWNYKGASGRQGKGISLEPGQVMFARLWNPYDPILGQAPLEAGRIAARSDYRAARYNEEFFAESAIPGGIISTEQKLGKGQRKRLKEMFGDEHGGFRKGHRLAVLEKGLKYERVALTQSEMDFAKLRDKSAMTIMQCFGMKQIIISITETTNYATAKEQRREWWQDTNLPLMRQLASSMNSCPAMFLNTPYIVRFDTSSVEALQEDFAGKVDTAGKLFNLGVPFAAANERLELGFDHEPWMDQGYLPMNLIPVEGPRSRAEEIPDDEEPKGLLTPEQVGERLAIPYQTAENAPTWETKAARVWKGLIQQTDRLEHFADGKVRSVFYKMRKRVLAMVDAAKDQAKGKAGAPDPASLYLSQAIDMENFSREKTLMEGYMGQAHGEALMTGAASAAAETGLAVALDLSDSLAIDYLAAKRLKVVGVVNTVKMQLRDQISAGMAEGEAIDTIASRIRSVFNTSTARARTIARTEVVGAANFGRNAQLSQTGFREVQWFTAMDEKVRPDHMVMNGQIRRQDQPWTMPDGSSLRYPGDYSGSAGQVINCRCIEVAVPGSHEGEEEEE